jgi:hypothetical protein
VIQVPTHVPPLDVRVDFQTFFQTRVSILGKTFWDFKASSALLADWFLGSLEPGINRNACPSLEIVNTDSLTENSYHPRIPLARIKPESGSSLSG